MYSILIHYSVSILVQAVKICHENFSKTEGMCEIYRTCHLQCITFVEEVIKLIEESLHLGMFSFIVSSSLVPLFELLIFLNLHEISELGLQVYFHQFHQFIYY